MKVSLDSNENLRIGDRVDVLFLSNGNYYAGSVSTYYIEDKELAIDVDDGDTENLVMYSEK